MITTGAICIKTLLMENKKLQVLNIGSNQIGNEGVAAVCEGLCKKNTLTGPQLCMNKCGLSVEGIYSYTAYIFTLKLVVFKKVDFPVVYKDPSG